MDKKQLVAKAGSALGKLKVAVRNAPAEQEAELLLRMKHTADILAKYRSDAAPGIGGGGSKLRLFLSHDSRLSLENGDGVFKAAKAVAHAVYGIETVTGGLEDSQDKDILNDVIKKISSAELFIAIISPDQSRDGALNKQADPTPWITFELGVALGLDKPIGVLLTNDVPDEYHKRLFPHIQWVQSEDLKTSFDSDFKKTLDFAINQFAESFDV